MWMILCVLTGKSLAYTRVDFYNAKGQLAAYGRTYPLPSLLLSIFPSFLPFFLPSVPNTQPRKLFPSDHNTSPFYCMCLIVPPVDHTKYVGKSAGHEQDVKFSEDGEKVLEGSDVD